MARSRVRHRAGALLLVAVVATLVALALAAGSPTAHAQGREATAAEVRALAEQAVTDDGALAELRSIEVVDGRPVDLAAATADLGTDRPERLRALARTFEGTASSPVDRAEARRQAARVLEADKYQEPREPRPFRGVLRWLADRLRPVGRPFAALWDAAAELPGGGLLLLCLLGGLVGLAVFALAGRGRGAAVAGSSRGTWLVDPELDPADLEARAAEAEARGELGVAVRLRYEAGLLRLARQGRVVLRPDTTPYGAASQVADPTLDRLTATFVELVYGDRRATDADLGEARQGWDELLAARARR